MLFLFIWFALAWTWALQGKRMMDAGLSWDEFRLVKAIADTRSLSGAAERLGLNHSTIFRRLSALEKLVGVKLFERSRGGYETTAAGREMAVLAGAMSDSIVDFERRVAGRDANPTGLLRVTSGELIGRRFVPALMTLYRDRYPSVTLELTVTNRVVNLSRREADVALRLTNDPFETLVGRQICSVQWAPYCRMDLLERKGSADLELPSLRRFRRRLRHDCDAQVGGNEHSPDQNRREGQLGGKHGRAGAARFRSCATAVFFGRGRPQPEANRPAAARSGGGLVDFDSRRSQAFNPRSHFHGSRRRGTGKASPVS